MKNPYRGLISATISDIVESPINGSDNPEGTPDAAALFVTPLGHSLVTSSEGNEQALNCIITKTKESKDAGERERVTIKC